MDNPVTVGSLVAGALSMTAEAELEGAVGEAVKDAYNALKEKVSHWAFDELAALEVTPSSKGRQVVVAEIINAQSEDDRKSLRVLAETLVAKLKENASAIGLNVGRLTALEAQLGNISVGVGGRIHEVEIRELVTVSGNFVISGTKIGIEPVNPWPQPETQKK